MSNVFLRGRVRPPVIARRSPHLPLLVRIVLAAPGACAMGPALAQTSLPPVEIRASPEGSLTVPSPTAQRDELQRQPGAVGFVDTEAQAARRSASLRDVLQEVPGVLAQDRYGQELRLSMRGSGVNRAFHTRGVEILQDGVPTNLADGSGDFYQIDPLALRAVEVLRGGNGFQYGATMLGGAINFVTPTARTAVAPTLLRLEGGSFGSRSLSAQISGVRGDTDALATVSLNTSQGYRRHADGRYAQVNLNVGQRLGAGVETRFYLGVYDVAQQLPGTLTLAQALADPRAASAAAQSGDQARDVQTVRVANLTSWRIDADSRLDVATWAIHKRLLHPIFQVLDQDGWTYGLAPRYRRTAMVAGLRNELVIGGRVYGGSTSALQFLNIAGSRGSQTLGARQQAFNLEGFVENRLYVQPQWALTLGAKAYRSERRYIDHGGLATDREPASDRRSYAGVNPKVGVLWQATADIQAFANLTRSADVPDFSDLNQNFAGTTRFVPLAAQRAWTVELGTRGQAGRFSWDVVAYRSRVRGQLLGFTVNPSVPAATFNADRTVLQGVEFAGAVELARGLVTTADRLTLSQVWTFSDYRFEGDAQYGSNTLPVVPRSVMRTTLSYAQPVGLGVSVSVDHLARGAWVDYANTQRAPGHTLLGLSVSHRWANGALIYLEGRNLTDRRFISDLGAITRAGATNTAVYYPGSGRALFAGLRLSL